MAKYTDARYPEKINDLISNDGQLTEEGKEIIGGGSKDYILNLVEEEEPSQEQLAEIYSSKPDRIIVADDDNKLTYYYKQEDNPNSTRLYYSNIAAVDSLIFCAKIEYSLSDDEYIFELYTFSLTPVE